MSPLALTWRDSLHISVSRRSLARSLSPDHHPHRKPLLPCAVGGRKRTRELSSAWLEKASAVLTHERSGDGIAQMPFLGTATAQCRRAKDSAVNRRFSMMHRDVGVFDTHLGYVWKLGPSICCGEAQRTPKGRLHRSWTRERAPTEGRAT